MNGKKEDKKILNVNFYMMKERDFMYFSLYFPSFSLSCSQKTISAPRSLTAASYIVGSCMCISYLITKWILYKFHFEYDDSHRIMHAGWILLNLSIFDQSTHSPHNNTTRNGIDNNLLNYTNHKNAHNEFCTLLNGNEFYI